MATTSQCRTETLFYTLQLGLMNTKAHTHTHMPGALMQRERKDKVMESRNIIKSELFHPFYSKAEENRLVAGGADAHSNPG